MVPVPLRQLTSRLARSMVRGARHRMAARSPGTVKDSADEGKRKRGFRSHLCHLVAETGSVATVTVAD